MTLAAAAAGRERRGAGSEERPVLGDYAVTTRCNLPELERSSMAKDTRLDQCGARTAARDLGGPLGH